MQESIIKHLNLFDTVKKFISNKGSLTTSDISLVPSDYIVDVKEEYLALEFVFSDGSSKTIEKPNAELTLLDTVLNTFWLQVDFDGCVYWFFNPNFGISISIGKTYYYDGEVWFWEPLYHNEEDDVSYLSFVIEENGNVPAIENKTSEGFTYEPTCESGGTWFAIGISEYYAEGVYG